MRYYLIIFIGILLLVEQSHAVAAITLVLDESNSHSLSEMNRLSSEPNTASIQIDTHQIGSTEQPTIEGGWLNAAAVDPVNHDFSHLPMNNPLYPMTHHSMLRYQARIGKKTIIENVDSGAIASPQLKDNTAERMTDKRLWRFLWLAATEGKLAYVLQQLEKRRLPASLALIPMVESAYQNESTSTRGAAGAWQLMPAVARDNGLQEQDRYDFKLSTNTALNLLQQLYQQFGQWELVLAAYNAGAKRVHNALQQNPLAENCDALTLPPETKQYLHRFNAIQQGLLRLSEPDPNSLN